MTKKLENLFNLPNELPDSEDSAEIPTVEDLQKNMQTLAEINQNIDKIDHALPMVQDLDAADTELDDLSELSRRTAEDLISMGMNVEARFSGTILQTAGVMMGHAITAKQAKIDKKLRMIDLQLKKMRLDHQISTSKPEAPQEANATVIDRNELLKRILAATKAEKNNT
jgi:hypothetical protein